MSMTNTWTCLLLLFALFAVGMTTGTQCPTNCSCIGDSSSATTSMTVDCQGHPDVDPERLSDQLDSLLSSNLTYGRLRSLSIINSPLTHVPRSLCRLTTLTELHLDHNRLTGLPHNCLSNLSNLFRLTASDNAIVTLHDGVFDGLRNLYSLDLRRNRISSIGLSVFAVSSDLDSLFHIDIAENNLTSLEPWLLERGIIGSFGNVVWINLTHNNISKFTNEMGYHGCDKGIPFTNVDLSDNNIRHIENILKGWQLDIGTLVSCYGINNGQVSMMVWMNRNNILCDCVNYNFYKIEIGWQNNYNLIGWQRVPAVWKLMDCTIVDPITKKSSSIVSNVENLSLFVCELTERCPAGCVCVRRPANATLHVYCSSKNITVLPL